MDVCDKMHHDMSRCGSWQVNSQGIKAPKPPAVIFNLAKH